jgi:hypothetical protein
MTNQFPDATKKVLSPAAQVIINAAVEAGGKYGRATPVLHARLAAAIRAAADQVVPVPIEAQTPEEHWALLGVKNRLLAIADELEDLSDGPAVSSDREPASVNNKLTNL